MDDYDALVELDGGIDPVTSFGDRDALLAAVEDALLAGSPPRVLAVFDLAGLDEHRRINGLIASDQLVLRLARRFADSLGASARCFRSRSDEFWALVDGAFDETRPRLDRALAVLREDGRTAEVRASFGVAFLPDEAEEPMEALMIADRELGVVRRARERRASPRSITPSG